MASSYGFYDIIIWGAVAVLVQILAFVVLDKFLKNLSDRIEKERLPRQYWFLQLKYL